MASPASSSGVTSEMLMSCLLLLVEPPGDQVDAAHQQACRRIWKNYSIQYNTPKYQPLQKQEQDKVDNTAQVNYSLTCGVVRGMLHHALEEGFKSTQHIMTKKNDNI